MIIPPLARRFALLFAVMLLGAAGCSPEDRGVSHAVPAASAPTMLVGHFTDDYDNAYEITDTLWTQLPHGRFHIVEWDTLAGFLIAQNDSSNAYAPGLWSRIDWVKLDSMPPYGWAFCLSAYEAATMEEAKAATAADKSNPRVGCNGYPFSRMKREH